MTEDRPVFDPTSLPAGSLRSGPLGERDATASTIRTGRPWGRGFRLSSR